MNFFTRLSNGWNISMNSFKVLRANKQLIVFPLISGICMLLVIASFFTSALAYAGWDIENLTEMSMPVEYLLLFLYYVINYFVVVFFNTALIHCTRLYFKGEEVTVGKGIRFSMRRLGAIFSWAVFAATVGLILRIIQENVGVLGRIITGLIGIVWSIATFFVVPVIAYENAGPIKAFKRSSQLMKEKWGESLGATFSFGLIQLAGILLAVLPCLLIGFLFNVYAGIILGALTIFLMVSVMSAVQSIFISLVYHDIAGDPIGEVQQQMVDNLFMAKK